jgi:hypothetical protein
MTTSRFLLMSRQTAYTMLERFVEGGTKASQSQSPRGDPACLWAAMRWFVHNEQGGFPVLRAALDDCDLSVLHIGGEWQWLVRQDRCRLCARLLRRAGAAAGPAGVLGVQRLTGASLKPAASYGETPGGPGGLRILRTHAAGMQRQHLSNAKVK